MTNSAPETVRDNVEQCASQDISVVGSLARYLLLYLTVATWHKLVHKDFQRDNKPNMVILVPPVPATMLLIIQLLRHANEDVEASVNVDKHRSSLIQYSSSLKSIRVISYYFILYIKTYFLGF